MSRRIARTAPPRNLGGRPPSSTPRKPQLPRAVSVTAETHAALKSEATRRGVTLSAIVAEFVDAAEKEQA